MKPIAIEGHKGAGKTPLIRAMSKHLDDAGIKYNVVAPWHVAIEELGDDPYHCFVDPKRTKDILNCLTKTVIDSFRNKEDDEVLIYDRHWATFLMSLSLINNNEAGVTERQLQNFFREWIEQSPYTIFIASTPHILKNRGSRKGPPPWNEDADYWARLRVYNLYRDNFSGIYWVRKPRIDMSKLASKILSRYFGECYE